MNKYTQVIILCEDRQQEVFARFFLIQCGIEKRRIRSKIAPYGKGSGEQFVRESYAAEVVALRSKNYLNVGLVVLIDADPGHDPDFRINELDDQLADKKIARRAIDEKIGVFVPKRNIETWIHYLKNPPVNEIDAYPKLLKPGKCKPFVQNMAKSRKKPLAQDAPNSLKCACAEIERLAL
ncbi:conserved hypothetical protein [Desulfamplus magnetovallimortis]|uniref:DUF4276 family protein n=1 Tax=Desulfamplus magnetovallimortis TaxID=1246637 RepID=A0A1W1HHZ1_9BACT|nr:hypothetical protein [Desulfamplus magnetovallimortis]SLM32089.1 conserved hypothetical protein [Desulfamplus magnetovallimortis]